MVVDINEIERCLRYFKAINDANLDDIVWMRGEDTLRPTPEQLQEFALIGLSNRDFPSVVGWIPEGVGVRVSTLVITAAPNAIGQGSAACGASPAPTGCASNGTNNERTNK